MKRCAPFTACALLLGQGDLGPFVQRFPLSSDILKRAAPRFICSPLCRRRL